MSEKITLTELQNQRPDDFKIIQKAVIDTYSSDLMEEYLFDDNKQEVVSQKRERIADFILTEVFPDGVSRELLDKAVQMMIDKEAVHLQFMKRGTVRDILYDIVEPTLHENPYLDLDDPQIITNKRLFIQDTFEKAVELEFVGWEYIMRWRDVNEIRRTVYEDNLVENKKLIAILAIELSEYFEDEELANELVYAFPFNVVTSFIIPNNRVSDEITDEIVLPAVREIDRVYTRINENWLKRAIIPSVKGNLEGQDGYGDGQFYVYMNDGFLERVSTFTLYHLLDLWGFTDANDPLFQEKFNRTIADNGITSVYTKEDIIHLFARASSVNDARRAKHIFITNDNYQKMIDDGFMAVEQQIEDNNFDLTNLRIQGGF